VTPQRLGPSSAERRLSLRVTLLVVALTAGAYAAALPVYLFFRVSRPALALGVATDEITTLSASLARRDSALLQTLAIVRAEAGRRSASPDSVRLARRLLTVGGAPLEVPPSPSLPPGLRAELTRLDDALSQVASALGKIVALLEQGQRATAAARFPTVERLTQVAGERGVDASRIARTYLIERHGALQAAAGEVRRDVVVWLLVGLVLLPTLAYTVRRRIWGPLRELEAGLAAVANGDLTVQASVRGPDELGRLAEHFNAMTRVLRDRAEEQGRFAAAGELLAGVAHEVNNPLMAIAAHAENRLADPEVEGEQRSEMMQILRQARRATKLLRGLLRFVRVTEREVTRVNLNDVVRGALDLLSFRFGVDEITVGGRLDPQLPAVLGDAIKLEQIVVNLISNAIDALHAVKPPRRLIVDTYIQDDRVCAAVEDNGKGVVAEIAPRLFQPFATSKGRRGTGLGLYISRQIAREGGGDLTLAPPSSAGARFVLSLPPASPAPPAQAIREAAASPGRQVQTGSLVGVRVLIVEDEEAVRRPMVRFLARRGAKVEEATDGLEALERLRVQSPDVIIADLRMPRMGGVELFAQLEDAQPELARRLLFLSGDVSQLAEPGNTPVPRERVLIKPVELAELERRIVEFLRGGGG
jgi:signal transduction histidine kinase/CheY-like chemotaxis protein